MVLVRSIQAYFENIVTSIIFVLMGVFGFFFILLSDFYLSSGNVFLEYGFWNSPLLDVVVSLALIFISLAFFCVFCAAVIFAVRADLTKVKFLHYVTEKLPRFSMELFEFYFLLFVAELVIGSVLLSLGVPNVVVALVLLVLNAVLVFVPQSIVVDELSWVDAVGFNLNFVATNPGTTLWVWLAGIIMVGALPFIELFFDRFDFAGRFVSLFVALLIVVPLYETMKTVAFMTKFGLVKESMNARKDAR
ncbi:MAG: hypothetical protein J4215_01200 [Candidatus Diapherotrites archaeon]|uniref:Uncharacterized protein n=1 Tax=Candidatus Iainarchaeum sp. TaxID=3101447 RepID=A0A8T4L328_9ARCH|nr:hypothetical protein [Candidatus Diapherotrites archaeon]